MSFLLDANLLVYAAMPGMREHRAARAWLGDTFADNDGFVGLAWSTLYAFARLVSSRRIMGDDAVGVVAAWSAAETYLRQPTVVLVEPGRGHARLAADLFATPGLSSNDVPDVYLAALAIERGLTLATRDHGFARFANLRWVDPLS